MKKKNIKLFLFAIFVSVSLSFDIEQFMMGPSLVKNGLSLFCFDFFLSALLTFLFYQFFKRYNDQKLHPLKYGLAMLLSFFMVIGKSYDTVGSWDLIFKNVPTFLLSVCLFTSYTIVFKNILSVFDQMLEAPINQKEFKGKLAIKFKQHPFLFSLCVLLLFWSIYMIAFYPLILSKDPSFQIKQFFNVKTKYMDYIVPLDQNVNMTNHHPVLHTLLLGGFIKMGRFFGSDNFGLFLYALVQSFTLASSIATTVFYVYKKQGNVKWCFVLLAIYAITPCFPFYAMSAVKDTFYTAFLIFYVLALLFLLEYKKDRKLPCFIYPILFLLILLISLFRNNGLYIILLSFPFLFFIRRERLFLCFIFCLFLGSYFTYDKILLPHFHITAGSKREALSVPFQQTARYVVEHENEVTKKQKRAIDTVLNYDTLSKRYNPVLSDPVKNEYNKYTTKEELRAYFKVWLQQFSSHPTTYIQATLHNTYGYFYPATTNWYFYYRYNSLITEDNLVDYHYNGLKHLRSILTGWAHAFPYIPIFGFLVNIGFQGMLLFVLLIYLLLSDKKKYLIALLPLYASFAICFASPANTYFRYSMPYLFPMPFIMSYTFSLLRRKEK